MRWTRSCASCSIPCSPDPTPTPTPVTDPDSVTDSDPEPGRDILLATPDHLETGIQLVFIERSKFQMAVVSQGNQLLGGKLFYLIIAGSGSMFGQELLVGR